MKINLFFTILISIIVSLLVSCSYEKMNSPEKEKFNIVEIDMTGDRRAAFIIQKKINRFSNLQSKNRIKVSVELKKNRNIQDKNIQNKVTKYNLSLTAIVTITDLLSDKQFKRTFNASQTYDVVERYSSTLDNEKNANNALIDKIVDEILDQIKILYN